MKTWADLHVKPEKKGSIDKNEKYRKGFDEVVYKKKRTNLRVFDEHKVLTDPYRWKDKILKIVPEHQYHAFQAIFNLPDLEDKEGPERDYTIWREYIPQYKKGKSIIRQGRVRPSISSSMASSNLSIYKPSMRRRQAAQEVSSEPSSEMSSVPGELKEESSDTLFLRRCRLEGKKKSAESSLSFSDVSKVNKEKKDANLDELATKERSDDQEFNDLYVNPPTRPPTPPEDILEDRRSAYQKFLTKTDDEITSTWRKPKGVSAIAEMSWEQRGDAATDEIVKELINWMKEKFDDTMIDEAILKEMFRVDWTSQAQRSMKVEMKELAAVPGPVAKIFNIPGDSERAALHRQIIWDSLYERLPERKIGFGRSNPKYAKKWGTNTRATWFSSDIIPPDLQSGSLLWQDLFGTQVLDNFCQWLLENPKYIKPKYLVTSGYFDKFADQSKSDSDLKISFAKLVKNKKDKLNLTNENTFLKRNAKIATHISHLMENLLLDQQQDGDSEASEIISEEEVVHDEEAPIF